jgi:hypothetical protein
MTTKLIASQGEVKQLRGRWRSGVGAVGRLTKIDVEAVARVGHFSRPGNGV